MDIAKEPHPRRKGAGRYAKSVLDGTAADRAVCRSGLCVYDGPVHVDERSLWALSASHGHCGNRRFIKVPYHTAPYHIKWHPNHASAVQSGRAFGRVWRRPNRSMRQTLQTAQAACNGDAGTRLARPGAFPKNVQNCFGRRRPLAARPVEAALSGSRFFVGLRAAPGLDTCMDWLAQRRGAKTVRGRIHPSAPFWFKFGAPASSVLTAGGCRPA